MRRVPHRRAKASSRQRAPERSTFHADHSAGSAYRPMAHWFDVGVYKRAAFLAWRKMRQKAEARAGTICPAD
jgi:hypothetical protein